MNQQKLDAFIRRIVETSPDEACAQAALEQLKGILLTQLSAEDLAHFSMANDGVSDSLPAMKLALRDDQGSEALRIAAERAKQQRIQDEIAAAHGRC